MDLKKLMMIMIFKKSKNDNMQDTISDEEFVPIKEYRKLKRLIEAHQYHINHIYTFYNLEPTPFLDEIRKIAYGMLEYLDNVCRKYGIEYWIDADTLLGAVRHDDYMPWNDDLNIGILNDDLVRLKSVLPNEIKSLKNVYYDEADVIKLYFKCSDSQEKLVGIKVTGHEYDDTIFPLTGVELGYLTVSMPNNPHDYLKKTYGEDYIHTLVKIRDAENLNEYKKQDDFIETLKEYNLMLKKANENFSEGVE